MLTHLLKKVALVVPMALAQKSIITFFAKKK